MSVVWQGARELKATLDAAGPNAERLLAGALFTEGELIMSEAKRITPVDTGRLRASGNVKPPEHQNGTVTVELAYGTDYAIYVHEITSNTHPVGQAKFLEQPVKAAAAGLERRLAGRIQKGIF